MQIPHNKRRRTHFFCVVSTVGFVIHDCVRETACNICRYSSGWHDRIGWRQERQVKSTDSEGKGHPRTGREGQEGEQMYSSTLLSTSVQDGVGGRRHAPADLPPRKTRYPSYRRMGGPQCRTPDREVNSESLQRLRYSGPRISREIERNSDG
jgi:hypothetical protein